MGVEKLYSPAIRSAVCNYCTLLSRVRPCNHSRVLPLSARDVLVTSHRFSLEFVNTFAPRNFRRAAFQAGSAPYTCARHDGGISIKIPLFEITITRKTCSTCEASCFQTRLFRVNRMVLMTFFDGNQPCLSANTAANGS